MKLGRVLVAEDQASIRSLLEALLRRAGAQVVTCEEGQSALELATREPFDVILLDMQMPGLDGYTVAQLLRARGNRTPVIALTASDTAVDRERCLDSGCDDHLPKPIHREKLIQTLARYAGAQSHSPRLHNAVSELPSDTANELKAVFVRELHGECDRLDQQLSAGDPVALRHLLHQIKGSTAAFGFDDLSQLAANAELTLDTRLRLDQEAIDNVHRLLTAMRKLTSKRRGTSKS